jgi:dynactin-5
VTPTSISIGRCTVISQGSVIKPPSRISRGQVHYYPMKIGDNVFVGMFIDTFTSLDHHVYFVVY